MAREIRSKYIDPIFGVCEEFKLNQLPTEADVLKNVLFYQMDKNKSSSFKTYINNTLNRLKNVWERTSIARGSGVTRIFFGGGFGKNIVLL